MILSSIFDQFVEKSPISVMARATVEHALNASDLDALFEETAETGYTRTLLFSTLVDLMSLVVCGKVLYVQSAFQQIRERVPVTLKSVYEKLQNIELSVSVKLVSHVACRCAAVIRELGGGCAELLPGYRVRILDGNHLAATQKRLKVTRGHSAGVLPGQCLAVLDPVLMLITDLIPCEDAHTQERALLGSVLDLVQKRDVWIDDRNFCTVDFLRGIDQREAFFVTRRHGNVTVEPEGERGPEVETQTGWVSEQACWVCRDGERMLRVRSVVVRLKEPTEDGDTVVEILTNLAAKVADAVLVASLYLKRWKIEVAFHELTTALKCEVNTLGYPKAALFAFAVAVAAYNILSVQKAALRTAHGEEKVRTQVSAYYIALEWASVNAGMMIALPDPQWAVFGSMSAHEFAGYLRQWAKLINMDKIKKAPPRKPTKHKTPCIKDKSPHLSTARLLDEAKKKKKEAKKIARSAK